MAVKELSECRVLIVDDVKANVDMLVEALRGDFKLSVALDGEAALRAVEKSAPDLLLLDIVMPGLDGYEVCRRLRAQADTRDLPIMFLSSLEDVRDKARGFELGANDYLTKPFEILEVKARVRSLLKAKAYADAIRAAQERDLAIAREIQMGILPSDLTSLTRGTGLDVHRRDGCPAVGRVRHDDGASARAQRSPAACPAAPARPEFSGRCRPRCPAARSRIPRSRS